ncbi:AAA-like domain-containing protein (plasmid) [Nostoc sp. UHCC 0926]|uniref:AAA-like domain-containing protein n=1 Tax=Nostoc sp. UHCC 0926 TaxID=3025190 RepID=UPI002362D387|nr:AAA-like domain-containing protein [Nostoc sp. UHCC 0926]WDD36455.1 AAA-like domain-containing protein [Nostoc sp. UHCC 0926]
MRSIEQIIECTETLINDKTGKSLSFIQKAVLSASLLDTKKSYGQIATENNYSENYIRQLVAPKLWQLLSITLGEKVNRTNCRAVLEQRLYNSSLLTISQPTQMRQKINLEPPDGQVPLSSTLYIERGLEQVCYQAILQPRAFIHIKAPRKMGKTSLMTRILAYGSSHGYHTVRLSLHRAETEVFSSLEKFLRWFCANVTHQLGIKSKLEEYWDEDMGDLMNCTIYFQGYVLQEINTPLILALDEVNKLFEYPQLTRDFLGLLRSWYEETRDISVWQKLRVLIVKSTDIYINLEINKSPFNIGLAIDLPAFTRLQLEDLAQRHRLQLTAFQFEQLIALTGGFPYLVRLAFYHSLQHQIPMDTLLQNATTNTGIFSEYLHNQLHSILQNPDLVDGFQQVISSTVPINLEQEVAFKLKSLGLIYLENQTATVSCGLYREYFSDYFINKTAILNHS